MQSTTKQISLFLLGVAFADSASAQLQRNLSWSNGTSAAETGGRVFIDSPHVGPFSLAFDQESMNAFCNQAAEQIRKERNVIARPGQLRAQGVSKTAPAVSTVGFKRGDWLRMKNYEAAARIRCEPIG